MMVRVEYGVFATPGPVLVVDVGSDGLTVQLPTCRPRVKYDEVVRVVPAVCLTAGASPPPQPPVCVPVQQETRGGPSADGGAQGSAGAGEGHDGGARRVVVPARGRGDPEARVTIGGAPQGM